MWPKPPTIQQNLQQLKALQEAVKNHPLCLKLEMKHAPGKIMVTFPEGYGLGGVQVDYSIFGKKWALQKALDKMEQHWKDLSA